MRTIAKTCAAVAALTTAALPSAAAAACLNRTDMHAMQAAALQQRLMVAAFTCHDTAAYNRFVLGHRGELQKSDASLLAYFQKNGGTAAYHTYKTHLANAASLESSRSDSFCGDADVLFRTTSGRGSLGNILDRMPTTGTGYAACYVAEATPVSGASQQVARAEDYAPPVSSASHQDDRFARRRVAPSRWDRDGDDGPDAAGFDGPPSYRDAPPSGRDPRYAEGGNGLYSRGARDAYDGDDNDWRDDPAYDNEPYDDEGPRW
jgi:hypothetical protein